MSTFTPHPAWQWRWFHNGLILPWFTKPCLDWLVQQDLRERTVLEWGIGVDIPWWCANSQRFIGIEHDPGTGKDHQNVKPPPNAILTYMGLPGVPSEDDADTANNYVQAGIAACRAFRPNIIVVDGIYRVGCAHAAVWAATQDEDSEVKHIIVDNAEWPGLQAIRELFGKRGWRPETYIQPDHTGGWATDVWEVR